MGARYLTDLAEVCRLTGYPVIELDGWESRARGSGGYGTGKPDHVMCHHTASPPSADGWGDANYCTFADDDAPLANIVLSRVPELFICAAGATNTNGSGDCPHLAPDTMNSSAVGVEACNDGLGEAWPEGQQSCYVRLVTELCYAYNIPVAHVESHAQYAPSRKVDPAGPSRWADVGTWNMDLFRADLTAGPIPAPPEPGGSDMRLLLCRSDDGVPWVVRPDYSWRMAITEDLVGVAASMPDTYNADQQPIPPDMLNAIPTTTLAGMWPWTWTR